MVVLCLAFLVQFAVSVAALATPRDFEESTFERTWRGLSAKDRMVSACTSGREGGREEFG